MDELLNWINTEQNAKYFLVAFVIGAVSLLWVIVLIIRSARSRGWPAVTGKVLSSKVASYEGSDNRYARVYSAIVRYTYSVNGSGYESSKIRYDGNYRSSSQSQFNAIVRRYPEGSEVKVYYNPSNPEQALLEPGFSRKIWFPLFVSLLFIALGIFGYIDKGGSYFFK